jgi:hypothetical protein
MYTGIIFTIILGWVTRRKVDKAMSIAEIHKEVAREEQAAARMSSSSRRSSTSNLPSKNTLRRSSSLAEAPVVDDDGFVSISRASMKKVGSKTNMGGGPPASPSSGGVKKPAQSSLRRAVSQPAFSGDVPASPYDPKKIASKFGVSGAPSMPDVMENKPGPSVASPDQCVKKIQSILKEYYVGGDTDDAVLSVDELVQVSVEEGAVERGAKVIEGATLLAMEGKPADVPKMLSVMVRSVVEGKIPNASIVKGWSDPLEFLGDMEIDAPLAGKHLALIIAECLKLKALELTFLVNDSPEYFRTSGKPAMFAINVLKQRGDDPSDEDLAVVQSLMTDDDKKEFDSGKAMWEAKK